ncbi:MAG: hypothetical protein ABI165_03355 [Bryobacteraceae bacterium]
MKRKLVLLNFALAVVVAALGWRLRQEWVGARDRESMELLQTRKLSRSLAPPPVMPTVNPVTPSSYIDVAAKMLFSRDRNPTVVIEVPKPPPEPPVPPMPVAMGVMLWTDPPSVIMSEKAGGPQKVYRPGDMVGAFKLVSVDNQKVVLEWHGKTIEKSLDELMAKNAVTTETAGPSAPAAAAPVNGVTSLGGPTSIAGVAAGPGVDMGGGARACIAGDKSAPGTTADGYKKVENMTPFGSSCHWEAVK